jgi:hypothetical protein
MGFIPLKAGRTIRSSRKYEAGADEESWFAMNEAPSTRPPPRLVRVPWPDQARTRVVLLIVASCLIVFAIALAVFVKASVGMRLAGVFVVEFALIGVILRVQAKKRRRLWADMVRQCPGIEADPLAAALRAEWRRSWNPLGKPERTWEVLRTAGGPDAGGPWIVCLGPIEVPEVGERRFEPYIITAGEMLGRLLWFAPAAAILIAIWLLQVFHVIPGRSFNVAGFTYFIVMGVGVGAVWIWRTGIRPTYIRMAPGIVEFLEYRGSGRKPVIRSYRMEPGTLVLLTTNLKPTPLPTSVTLCCEGHRDVLAVGRMKNKTEAMERIWWALLSTAPIPRMDDEQLVG